MHNLFNNSFWGRGFRPFFFISALFAILSIIFWSGYYLGYVSLPDHIFSDPVLWHAHEMVFGFSMAVVAGFLLTAVANWTGAKPTRHGFLALLVLFWLVSRLIMFFDFGFPLFVNKFLIVSFIPSLIIALAFPLIRSWNKRNFIFLSILTIIFLSQLWVVYTEMREAIYIPLMMVILMVSLIGGRIIPAFTVSGLKRKGIYAQTLSQPLLDVLALISIIFVTLAIFFYPTSLYLSIVSFIAFVVHVIRMRYYNTFKTYVDPMLWILHLGYIWLVLGFILLIFVGFGYLEMFLVVHSLTIGCIGSMCIGMMCRVTLGHTGRNLSANIPTIISFALMQMAAVTRVFGTMVWPEQTIQWISISSVLWASSFALYLISYAHMLFLPRPDGAEA